MTTMGSEPNRLDTRVPRQLERIRDLGVEMGCSI